MAFAVNFGETDKANRLMWMLQQDWLGRKSQERRLEYLGEQESMYGRLGDARSQRAIKEMLQGHDLDKQLVVLKAMMDASKDATLDRFRKKAETLRAAGQAAAADDYERQFNEALPQFAERAKQVVEGGNLTKEDWAGVFDIVGVESGRDMMTKWQTGKKTELGFGELKEKELTRLGKEGVESKSQKSYYEHVKGLANQAITYIKGLDVAQFEGQAGAVTQKTKGNVLSMLRKLVARAKSGRLNREQELFLRDAMNIDKLKQMVNEQGEPIGFPGQAGSERGKEFMAETDRGIAHDKQMGDIMAGAPAEMESGAFPGVPTQEANMEEKVQALTALILQKAREQNKKISPQEAEILAKQELGVR